MWPHFLHLLSRIIHGMPVLVSSNWASWLILIGTFLLAEGLLLWREREHMREWWNKRWSNLALSLLVTAIVYTSLFLWSMVQTTYDDHHDSTGRWQAVVKEKNTLKDGLRQRDEYIKNLEAKSCPKPSGPSAKELAAEQEKNKGLEARLLLGSAAEPWKITPAGMTAFPVINPKMGKFARQLIFLTNKTVTPINLTVACDHDIESLSAIVSGAGVQMGGARKTTSNSGYVGITAPAWTPTTPLLLFVTYNLDLNDPQKHNLNGCSLTTF